MQDLNIKEYFEIQIELFYELCVCFWSVLIATSPELYVNIIRLKKDKNYGTISHQALWRKLC